MNIEQAVRYCNSDPSSQHRVEMFHKAVVEELKSLRNTIKLLQKQVVKLSVTPDEDKETTYNKIMRQQKAESDTTKDVYDPTEEVIDLGTEMFRTRKGDAKP